MKKITFIALHLGYGGIEKAISQVSNMLQSEYEIEIVSIYKIYEKPKFEINGNVKVKYLIQTDLPQKLNKYKMFVKSLKIKELIQCLLNEYIKKFKIFTMFHDFIYGTYILTVKRKSVLKKYLKTNKSNIYISTHMFMNKILNKYAKGNKISWEHNHHNENNKYISKIRNACKYVETMIVVSEGLEQYYTKDFKEKEINCKVEYIPNFIEKMEMKENIQENKQFNSKRLISIGRLSKEKGFLDLIDIMEKLIHIDKEIKLDLVGDGNQYQEIKEKIKEKKLENNIIMHGYLNQVEINKLFLESKVYIMTSYTESFGLVLLEAMNMGLVCIAFDTAQGACEIINSKNGILVKNRDKDLMVKNIMKLISYPKENDKYVNGIEETLEKYSEVNNKKIWIDFIENMK